MKNINSKLDTLIRIDVYRDLSCNFNSSIKIRKVRQAIYTIQMSFIDLRWAITDTICYR